MTAIATSAPVENAQGWFSKTEAWLDDLPDDFDPLIYLDGAKET